MILCLAGVILCLWISTAALPKTNTGGDLALGLGKPLHDNPQDHYDKNYEPIDGTGEGPPGRRHVSGLSRSLEAAATMFGFGGLVLGLLLSLAFAVGRVARRGPPPPSSLPPRPSLLRSRGPGARVRRRRARAVFGGCSRGGYALSMLSALRGVSGQGDGGLGQWGQWPRLITERTLPLSLPRCPTRSLAPCLPPPSLTPSLAPSQALRKWDLATLCRIPIYGTWRRMPCASKNV